MKSNLSQSFIERMKSLLSKRQKELEVEKRILIDDDPYLEEGRESDNEYMDDVSEDVSKEEYDLRMEVVKNSKENVDKALNKIEEGDYGVCESCGNPINEKRLEAFPEATLCADCAK